CAFLQNACNFCVFVTGAGSAVVTLPIFLSVFSLLFAAFFLVKKFFDDNCRGDMSLSGFGNGLERLIQLTANALHLLFARFLRVPGVLEMQFGGCWHEIEVQRRAALGVTEPPC